MIFRANIHGFFCHSVTGILDGLRGRGKVEWVEVGGRRQESM